MDGFFPTARLFRRWADGQRFRAVTLKTLQGLETSALGYFAHVFIKIHGTLRVTAARAASVEVRLWDVADLVAAWEACERRLKRAA